MNIIELAKKEEADLCGKILNDGKEFQQEQGFVQWTNDYPNIDTVYKDIETEKGYVLKIDGFVECGIVVFQGSEKIAYDKLL